MSAHPPPKPTFEDDDDVPDPDEDDLDDLDDMLDEFSAANLSNAPGSIPSIPSVVPPRSTANAGSLTPPKPESSQFSPDDDISEEEFAKQLQESMANLLGGMGADSKEMQAQFEDIFKQISTEAAATAAAATTDTASPATAPAPKIPSRPSTARSDNASDFQETIRKTIERMQTSGDQATAAAAANGSDDFLTEMLKQMGGGSGGAGIPGLDGGGEEDFSKMLMGMMEQLTNKDILYEPMKELNDRFPAWMAENQDKISAEDTQRYQTQQKLVKEIVAKFDDPKFSDDNAADRQYIVERMQKMQDAGSPPPDLVGDMPSAQDALGAPDDEACNPQ
ncbi:Peroxisomal biogenesis factor 19 [Ceratocystis lukuohia]|uniref:Peroxisomal biogenesis factor 19 n=1 Tax=Ceratocystis lukuohia TaxID=2019550 RepID=A0ABR4MLG2_9PEZI